MESSILFESGLNIKLCRACYFTVFRALCVDLSLCFVFMFVFIHFTQIIGIVIRFGIRFGHHSVIFSLIIFKPRNHEKRSMEVGIALSLSA